MSKVGGITKRNRLSKGLKMALSALGTVALGGLAYRRYRRKRFDEPQEPKFTPVLFSGEPESKTIESRGYGTKGFRNQFIDFYEPDTNIKPSLEDVEMKEFVRPNKQVPIKDILIRANQALID